MDLLQEYLHSMKKADAFSKLKNQQFSMGKIEEFFQLDEATTPPVAAPQVQPNRGAQVQTANMNNPQPQPGTTLIQISPQQIANAKRALGEIAKIFQTQRVFERVDAIAKLFPSDPKMKNFSVYLKEWLTNLSANLQNKSTQGKTTGQ